MQLALLLASRFGSIIRERGYQYFRQQRVRIQHGSTSELGAEVRGSQLYQVMLRWTGSQLAVLCDCGFFFDQDQPCKHLWAAILAADANNLLSDAAAAPVLTLDTNTLLEKFAEQDAGLAEGEAPLQASRFQPSNHLPSLLPGKHSSAAFSRLPPRRRHGKAAGPKARKSFTSWILPKLRHRAG